MDDLALIASCASLLLVLVATFGLLKMRREIQQLKAQAQALVPPEPLPSELIGLVKDSSVTVCLEVLNPMELAAQRHWLAGVAGRMTPAVVRPIVAREVVRMVRSELLKFGVKADVRVLPHA